MTGDTILKSEKRLLMYDKNSSHKVYKTAWICGIVYIKIVSTGIVYNVNSLTIFVNYYVDFC